MKLFLKIALVIFVPIVVYVGLATHAWWKWETVHKPLPDTAYQTFQQLNHRDDMNLFAENVSQKLSDFANEKKVVSVSAAVSRHGDFLWADSTGFADVASLKLATPESIYRIGSVSKAITSLALAKMIEKKEITLSDTVAQWLPDYPEFGRDISVQQLASHTSGVRHYGLDFTKLPPTESYNDTQYDDVLDAVEYFKEDVLLFTPGENFRYSTYGYTLLSGVMQMAAKKPFLTVLQDELFSPLELELIGSEQAFIDHPDRVNNYNVDAGRYGATRPDNVSNKWAGGGLVAAPKDLVKLGGALLTGQLISSNMQEQIFMVQTLPDGSINPQYYALGWRHHETQNILGEDNPVDVVHHGGSSVGAVAFWLLVPEYGVSVAVMSNSRGDRIRRDIQMFAYELAAETIKHHH